MMSQQFTSSKTVIFAWIMTISIGFSSCYSYRVGTLAQGGAELSKPIIVNSYFWGLLKKPTDIHTPICDSLQVNGVAEVTMSTNFGYALITVVTLGIWSPMKVQWRCSKPCQKVGDL